MKKLIFFAWAIAFIAVSACSSGGGSKDSSSNSIAPTSANVELGDTIEGQSKTLDEAGGSLKIDDEDSPLYGTEVSIPVGALNEGEELSISSAEIDRFSLPAGIKLLADSALVMERSNEDDLFNTFVTVKVKINPDDLDEDDAVMVFYYDDENEILHETTVIEVDPDEGEIVFLTSHFSPYIITSATLALVDLVLQPISTGFTPEKDGFFIDNWGSYTAAGGNCLGMTSFARWHYLFRYFLRNDERLYTRWREGNPSIWYDDVIANQIASRGQLAESDIWDDTYQAVKSQEISPTQRLVAASLITSMKATGMPQLMAIYIKRANGSLTSGHAVMAHSWDGEYFHLYDPNFAGSKDRKIKFSYLNGFTSYNGGTDASTTSGQYNFFVHIAPSIAHNYTGMKNIYDGAVGGFDDDKFPEIEIVTPDPDETITEVKATITGKVTGGEQDLIDQYHTLHVFVNKTKHYKTTFDPSTREFSIVVPLYLGENIVEFVSTGGSLFDAWSGYALYNLEVESVRQNMVVTMWWDKGQSDIDLYVTQPDGETVWYSSKTSTIGAELDIDNTSGYGPEHYFLNEDDQQLFGEYEIGVHYYSDHDDDTETVQTIPWNVTVDWLAYVEQDSMGDEPVEYWDSRSFSGVLFSANSSNSSPGSTGADWADVWVLDYKEADPEEWLLADDAQFLARGIFAGK
jgi:uncharacterized protein YfaP (DUF2135 family)